MTLPSPIDRNGKHVKAAQTASTSLSPSSRAVETELELDSPTNISSATNWRAPLLIGWAVIAFGLGGGLAWATLAPLDSAVSAQGVVSVESNRKTVQHLEGGIVREILVRDGDHVEEGQALFRLDGTQAAANLEVIRNQRAAALAEEARLVAERDGAEELEFPQDVVARQTLPAIAKVIADQNKLFKERQSYLAAQKDVLESQVRQAEEELEGAAQERAAGLKQISWVDQELPSLRELYKKGLVQWTRITSLERQRAQLEGVVAAASATHARLLHSINETKLKVAELSQQFHRQVAEEIAAIRKVIAETEQKQNIAQDILNRLEVRAPQAGVVQGLKIFTPGAVIRQGDPLLDIVPLNEELVIRAQVSPFSMDVVHAGLRAEIRFPSFHLPYVPVMYGHIRSISYDRLIDEATNQPYFAADVVADRSTLPEEIQDKLRAGLPTDVVIVAGERTPLQYLLRPLTDRLRKGMREG